MVKDRTYYADAATDGTYMIETLIDKSMGIYLLNLYKRTDRKWERTDTFSYLTYEALVQATKDYKDKFNKLYYNSGSLIKKYNLKINSDYPEIYSLIKLQAEEILKDKTKLPKRFYDDTGKRLSYWAQDYLQGRLNKLIERGEVKKSFNLEEAALQFIDSVGYRIYINPDTAISFGSDSQLIQ